MRKFLIFFLMASSGGFVSGQSRYRFELGPTIGMTTFGTAVATQDLRVAYGGRVGVNLVRNLAIEYQMAYFPGGYSNSTLQGSGHLKLKFWEPKSKFVNLFAIIGPGFMHEEYEYIGGLYDDIQKFNSFALDYGAGIELVPHKRWGIRLDLTDFYAGRKYAGTDSLRNSTSTPGGGPRIWDHHLDFKSAVMFRF